MFDVVFSNWKASLVAFNLFTYPFPNDAPTLLFKSSFLPLSYTNKQVMRPKSSLIPQSSSFFGGNQQVTNKIATKWCCAPTDLPEQLRQTNLKFELCAIAPILALGYGRSCCPELSVRLVRHISQVQAKAKESALKARRASMHSSEMLGEWG